MTKKDYIAIGAILKDMRPWADQHSSAFTQETAVILETLDAVADRLCDLFEADNPRFMRNRFRAYVAGECGPNGGQL